ncbi:MAG: 1-acyl-sn-glycerol-3-phosphate acyltransferase [Tetrasphaera sp.]|nr:1-acyl-sn-glycerol-3-phosphate acyltransferase [Tetrasphaera sp.]
MLYWFLKRVLLGPILRLLFTLQVEGVEHIPADGAAILASNHLSFSDSFFLPAAIDRRVTFLAKSDYFTGRGLKGRLTAAFFRAVGQVPVDRTGGRASDAALESGLRILRRGELLGIYPEGTRSPDGNLYRGRTGVARLALEGKVAVLPVAMIDTDKAQPTGQRLPRLIRVGVRIGEPLDFSRYEGMEGDRFVLRSITDEIMYELMLLSGQDYVDIYASAAKKRLAAARGKSKERPEVRSVPPAVDAPASTPAATPPPATPPPATPPSATPSAATPPPAGPVAGAGSPPDEAAPMPKAS